MDAASAALIGAGIGLSGTVIGPLVVAWQGRRSRREELMRESYAAGFRVLAELLYIPEGKRKEVFQKILIALADIEMYGKKRTSKQYSNAVEALEEWVDGGDWGDFETPAHQFEELVRQDMHANWRWARRFNTSASASYIPKSEPKAVLGDPPE